MNILIIGCGLAGLSAAITAAENGDRVTVLAALPAERSQSVLAAGGINAALDTKGENDSWQQHCEDTMKAGAYLADEEAVAGLTSSAPGLIRSLAEAGVVFTRDENGQPDVRYFGGQKKKRTVYSQAGIGRQLVAGLTAVLRRYAAGGQIAYLTDRKFTECIIIDGRYAGIIAEDTSTGELEYFSSDVLIVASGGLGGLFGDNTGAVTSDGAVSAALFAAGMEMANLEMIQYHPTTIRTAQKTMLISEAARGEGGRLFTMRNGQRWYFMEDWYGEKGNLMPRDVVSRCIYKVCDTMGLGLDGRQQAGLDLTHLGAEALNGSLREITDTTKKYLGIDPAEDIIPVYPGIHYFMGGIYTDRHHRTSIPGIFAAGECACIYHGANRLGGNSTLGAIYGGRTAAGSANKEAAGGLTENGPSFAGRGEAAARQRIDDIKRRTASDMKDETGLHRAEMMKMIQEIMRKHMGIMRTGEQLAEGISALEKMADLQPLFTVRHAAESLAAVNFRLLGEAMIRSALFRAESRGAHARLDCPQTDDERFRKNVAARCKNGRIEICTDEIGRLFK